MYIKRIAESRLQELLSRPKVGIILGARQVGKTTLVRHVLAGADALFLNFDVEIERRRFLAASSLAPADGLRLLGDPAILVIDEAQRLPDCARVVKGWHDAALPVRILLLGSSSLNLLDQSAESLTGRNEKLMLPPLLFEETLLSQSWYSAGWSHEHLLNLGGDALRAFLLETMTYGSYPEAVLSSDKQSFLRNLSSDYLWKDVLQTGLIKSPELIRRLLMLLAHQTGSEVSVNELATQLHMARATVERYLELLEQTWVVFRLPAFSTNPRKEIAKSRKIFFWDTGIRNALLGAFSTDESRPDIGALWENWVIAEVAKRNLLSGEPAQLFFWRSRTQSEVDLVVRMGGKLRSFEIKWRATRIAGRAFHAAYGVEPVLLHPGNPFVSEQALA